MLTSLFAIESAALTSATGLIRSEVGRILGIRHAPSITFFPDAIPENAAHIEDLLPAWSMKPVVEAVQAMRGRLAPSETSLAWS